jgi:hypothetical protein
VAVVAAAVNQKLHLQTKHKQKSRLALHKHQQRLRLPNQPLALTQMAHLATWVT